MGLSIICYSLFTFAGYFVTTPLEFLVVRFFACLGVGGMWPTGVALASEAWSKVMLVASAPVVLGVLVLLVVPESPLWLSSSGRRRTGESTGPSGPRVDTERSAAARSTLGEVFRPPLLKLTLLGICLGAVPMMGNWGGANWLVPWAGKVEQAQGTHSLKAQTQWSKSAGAAVGSLLGGWLASQLGRRSTYFVFSLVSLAISNYIFWFLHPGAPSFLGWVAAIGFFGTIYFGWLPLYLPELFPTSVRATGTGVAFNFGRIATAVGVLGAGQIMQAFGGDYARMGRATCLVYLLGMIIIIFAPDTSRKRLTDG
jgi:MFS family permease